MAGTHRRYVTPSNIKQDWSKVPAEPTADIKLVIERMEWANKNCKGHYSRSMDFFWFEDEKDAFIFTLKLGEGRKR